MTNRTFGAGSRSTSSRTRSRTVRTTDSESRVTFVAVLTIAVTLISAYDLLLLILAVR